ncbi:MAG: glycosyltransferase family 8 protein [Acidaminococcaceae bacterium]
MDDKINIVFASDDNYAQHAAVAMASILKNTLEPTRINFFLIADEISGKKKAMVEQTVTMLAGKITFIKISNEKLTQGFVSGQISRACYFRLDIANILPKTIKKIIYLDCDLLVYNDIAKLWAIDMRGKALAAVCDYGIMASGRIRKQKKHYIGLGAEDQYFNSGVLVLDLELWRQEKYAEQVISLALTSHFPNHDQDALNKIFIRNWCEMPLCWNVIPPIFNLFPKILCNGNYRKAAMAAKITPAIFHYAGGYKPWEYERHEGFNDKYYEYLQLTEFRKVAMPQFDIRRKKRSIKRQLIRLAIADFFLKICD